MALSIIKCLSLRADNLVKKLAILYHYPCLDSVFIALAAHLYFSAASLPILFFPHYVYKPIKVEQLPLYEISRLYILDFIGPSAAFLDIISSKVDRLN